MGQYADLLDPSPDDARARLNLGAAAGVNADEAARNQALARRYGLPPEAVQTFKAEYTARAAAEDARPLLQQAPKLRGWLADEAYGQGRADVVHDDLPRLSAVERGVRALFGKGRLSTAFSRGLTGFMRGTDADAVVQADEILGVIERIERGELQTDADLARATRFASLFAGVGRSPQGLAALRQRAQDDLSENLGEAALRTRRLGALPSSPEYQAFQRAQGPVDVLAELLGSPWTVPTEIVAESLGTMAPVLPLIVGGGLAGGARGLAAATGVTSGSTEYASALAEALAASGADPTDAAAVRAYIASPAFAEVKRQAKIKASVVGAFDAATAGLAGTLLGRTPLRNLAAQTGAQAGGGAAGEGLGSAASGQEIDWASVIAEAVGEGPGAVLDVGTLAARRAGERILQRDAAAQHAEQQQQLVADLTALAEASKVRQRDPEAFAEFVDEITREEVPTLYADARALLQTGVTPAQLAAVSPTAAAQLEQAAATGGDVAIPAPEFLTSAPGSPILPALMQHLRTDPEAMSPSEAQAWLSSERGVQLQEQIEQATQRAMTDDAARTEVEAVKAEVLGMLRAAGRTGPAADSMAALISANTATLAADLGITVSQAWQQHGLRGVTTELPDGGRLDQQAFHGGPHRGIEREGFKLNKIGTGEGAQAYGWGIYFASRREVSEYYREKIGSGSLAAQTWGDFRAPTKGSMADVLADEFGYNGANFKNDDDEAIDDIAQARGATRERVNDLDFYVFKDGSFLAVADGGWDVGTVGDGGQLYEVEIPENDDLLDWDSPLSEQPPKVREALAGQSWYGYAEQAVEDRANARGKNATGRDLYRWLIDDYTPQEASEMLQAAGIKGLRYLDGGSRGAGEGTHNFVIWDEAQLTPEAAQIRALYQGRQSQGRAPNTRAEVAAARDALARIEAAGGVTSPDDLAAVLRVSGYSRWAESPLAGDLDAAAALRAELDGRFPHGDWKRPGLNQQGVVAVQSQWLRDAIGADPQAVTDLAAIADAHSAPVIIRGYSGSVEETNRLFADHLRPAGFEVYVGGQERDGRLADVLISYIRPKGNISRITPLYQGHPGAARALDFGERSVEQLAAEYAQLPGTDGGRLIDTDLVRELSAKYRADRSRAADIHAAASRLTRELYARALAQPVAPGREAVVFFSAGGGGSGKSTALRAVLGENRADITLDGTLSNLERARQEIEAALAADRDVLIGYVYRSPQNAAESVVERAIRSGRPVPVGVLADAHAKALEVVKTLAREYHDNDRVRVEAIDNDGPQGSARTTRLEDIAHVDRNQAKQVFRKAADRARAEGRLSGKLHAAFVSGRAGEDGASARGRLEPRREGENRDALGQPDAGIQGAYFPEQRVIALLNAKNLTTFLHEAGHYFFDQRLRIASALVAQQRQGASLSDGEQRILADMMALLRWHGFKGDAQEMLTEWYSLDFEQQRQHHERSAESFERYLFSGQAPSLELQTAFQRFAAWLKSWYRNLKDFLDAYPEAGKLNDEVRAVFDRMLATDAAIEEMQALRGMEPALTPEQAAALGVDLNEYNALGAQATEAAQAQLQTRGLRDMKWLGNARAKELRRLQKQAAQLRADVKREARAEVMREPVYRAWALLTGRDGAAPPAQESEAVKAWRDATSAWNDRRAQVKADAVAAERARLWDQSPEAAAEYPSAQARGMAKGQFLARHKRVTEANAEATAAQWEQEDPKPKRPDSEAPEDDGLGALGSARLDTSALREAYGSGQDAIWRKLSALRMTSDTRGSDPDAVAALFTHADGTPAFESGDAMIRALAEAEPPGQVIEALTDQKMLQQHGELATPEALEQAADLAVHNEARARMVATELQALDRATTVRGDAGTDAHGRRRTYDALAAAARQFAQGLVGRTRVRDLKPSRFTAAEAKHARAAQRALRAGDTAAAADAKRAQLIQHHTAREALQAVAEVDRIVRYLRRMGARPAKVHHSYNDQIEALLERFDLRAATDRKVDRRVSLRDWLAAQAEEGVEPDIDPAIANEALRTSWRELTVDELRALRDAVQQIEHVGRLKHKMLTASDKRQFGAARDALAGSIRDNSRGRVNTDDETASSVMGRARQGLKRFGYGHLKAAMLARTMDGGQDSGAAWELLIRPANDAADRETSMTAQASRDLAAILNPVLKGRDRSITFPGLPRLNGAVRSLNREQRLAVALNWGNEGNRQRLTSGYGWTPAQVQAVLQSLTAAEWHAVQAAWDRIEVYRPQIAALERRMTGKEPNWVEPAEVVVRTADGVDLTLRGGYYPVKYDPRASDRAEQQEKAELADVARRAAFTSTTTRRSFTKARVGEVHDRKLMLTLDGLFGGVSEVIHDLAWRETLYDINRLLRDEDVSRAIRSTHGVEVLTQFRSWASAIATDDRQVGDAMETAAAWARQSISVAGLGFNVMSALVQPLGLTQSIVRVGARWVGAGVKQYVAHPVRATHAVSAKSAFMAARSRTRWRELAEVRNRVRGQSAARAAFDDAAYVMMLRMQQAVDVPTWLGAYERAVAETGADEARAVALADQAVRDAQGSGLLADQSSVERGGSLKKLFTVFYSFFNTTLNLAVANGMTVDGHARRVANYALLFVVPVVLGFALKEALKPGGEDEDWEDTARKLAGEHLAYLLGTVVGLREFTGAFQAATNTSNFPADYRGPTGLRLVTDTVKLGQQIGQGEADAALLRATVSVAGDLFRLPAGQVNKTIQGAQAVADGETDGPVEAARALVFGFDRH